MTQPKWKTELGVFLTPLDLQAANAAGEDEAGGPPYQVPSWIPLAPSPNGSLLRGADGRVFEMEDPQAVLDATRMPIVLDWDHASAYGPFSAQPGRAAARILEIELRNKAMWGRCEWTAAGRESVEKGEYLYVSPTFRIKYDSDSDGPPEVMFLTGAGLVNNPNFTQLPALNRQEFVMPEDNAPQNTGAAQPAAAAADPAPAADAAANAADTEIATLRDELAELRRERQEREEARQAELNALRQELAGEREQRQAEQTQQREQAVSAALDNAIAEGRITPASRDYFLAQCRKEGGLQEFQAFVAKQPQMLADSGLTNVPAPANGQVTLTAREKEICAKMEIDPAEYLKTRNAAPDTGNGNYPPGL
ncbi:MAG: hypothetical protein OXP66_02335 [Candidatus Tectomicrobia bacterium]|nr:hypothetical protein [Candidatus Tectomicrobia bacterium]